MKITYCSPTWFWKGVFIALLVGIVGLFSYTGQTLQYNWNWRPLPQFFLEHQQLLVRVPQAGQVTRIEKDGSLFAVTFTTIQNEILTLRVSELQPVTVGTELYEDDAVGTLEQWHAGPLLEGLWTTLWLSFIAGLMGILIGTISALMRLSKNLSLRWFATLYIEVIRGTPLLVQLMIAYFFVGTLLNIDRNIAGLWALAIFSGAYFAEIIRAGLLAVSRGIMEASRALGLNFWQTLRYVAFPITFKRTLPSLTGQWINLIKDSSLVSVIAITDLSKAGREVAASTFATFEVWFSVAILYLLLTLTLSQIARKIENKVAFHD